MDARVEALAERAVQDPPPWLQPLGPVPEDPADRLQWTARAGAVAAYRELAGVDGDDPLGDRPSPTHPESQARWDAANQALHGPPPAGDQVSDEDLQAIVDRGERLAGQTPPIVVEDLRRAEQQARAAETDLGLAELTGRQLAAGDAEAAVPVEDGAAAARAEAARLEDQHQARQDWVAEHGPDLAAAQAAAAELIRRDGERAARAFAGLSGQELADEIANVEDDLAALKQRIDGQTAQIGTWEEQAAGWDQQADAVDWERPAWARHTQDRQAETAAVSRLTELNETLDRSVLRGGAPGP